MVRLSSQSQVEYAHWYHKSLVHRMRMMQETLQATLGSRNQEDTTSNTQAKSQYNKGKRWS